MCYKADTAMPQSDAEIQNIAWAINSNEPVKPLLVLTVTSVILIFDVTNRCVVGRLRGHGGVSTIIGVWSDYTNVWIHIAVNYVLVGTSDPTSAILHNV